ncbi:phosphatidate cytidylyltransferase [Thalassobacillus sp. CUG 92003]|uniref:phosphatidate cytidylyltransferase n=1 Tax=Thalassobacillus sp. CUG 92003 TaxID=2736641 RepID=UPI0015E758B3|nr:phosphatidate cytidylyltransferase [Thalassobacillus sp. CUG 92003]
MKQRTISSVFYVLIILSMVLLGGTPFQVFVYTLATIGLYELMRMKKIARYSVSSIIAMVLMWCLMLPEQQLITGLEIAISKAELTLLAVLLLLSYTVLVKNKFTFDDAGFLLISVIYVGMGFNYLIETEMAGIHYVFYALFVVWATDTGAYLFGRAFGKTKLWPKISPKKTVEGAIGGIVLACVVALIFQWVEPVHASTFLTLLVTVFVSIFGQIGDLVESAFKRHYAVKDSGNILPGHGGVLDRFDSLIFILPLLHLINFIT